MTTRGIHLEVVENADADSFINSFRRFVNRRGKPKIMHSDCGSNFKGAAKELKDAISAMKDDKVLQSLA